MIPFCVRHFRKLFLDKRALKRLSTKVVENVAAVDLSEFSTPKIRNFSIVAHIDHGKSTLADALLEHSGVIDANVDNAQVLDKLKVERERGITVKAQTAMMFHKYKDGETYLFNLIDTPGHVDFSYEVSRSLSACDAALLLVDAQQGVQAQTVANFWLAFEHNLTIIGVLNKIDLPNARPDVVEQQMNKLFELTAADNLRVSAKMRTGIGTLMDRLVEKARPPDGDRQKPLKAFVFDSWFGLHRGCYVLVLIKDGKLEKGQEILSMQTNKKYVVKEVGIMHPEPTPATALYAGQVGYVLASIRDVRDIHIGDTFCLSIEAAMVQPMPGFKKSKPVVFAGIFPMEMSDYDSLKSAIDRLSLNDPSVNIETEISLALGVGWRVGFLGALHMEVFIQRLESEYNANVVLTTPSVSYRARLIDLAGVRKRYDNQSEIVINDPSKFPENIGDVAEFLEPLALCTIISPLEYYKEVEAVCVKHRGEPVESMMIDNERILFKYRFPLSEIIVNFFNSLKKASSGYASFDYELCGYSCADLVKVTILLNGKRVDEFSQITLREDARAIGKEMCAKLKDLLPRQLFEITIQATIGKKVVGRADIKPISKDFKQKLKGNMAPDRLDKLVRAQREGKKQMKLIGHVQIPKEVFYNVFRRH